MTFFSKTLGGLNSSYYFRHLFFGVLISAIFIFISINNPHGIKFSNIIFFIINAMLYPYARFVYEQIIGFVMGDNVFFINAVVMLTVKVVTMVLCWIFSIFIAPLGLAYLYFYHSKAEK